MRIALLAPARLNEGSPWIDSVDQRALVDFPLALFPDVAAPLRRAYTLASFLQEPIVMPPRAQVIALTIAGAAMGLASIAAESASDPERWTLHGVRAYVSPETAALENAVVVIGNGRIIEVAKATAPVPADAANASCQGGFITAGFQNSHVHFTGEQFVNARSRDAQELAAPIVEMLTRYGFTTVVDTASDRDNTLALRTRIERGEIPGPRVLTVGLPLYPPNGIPVYLADLPKDLLDRMPQPAAPEAALAIVRANLDAGADGTKLFVATPQRDGSVRYMPLEVARAAVEETHRRGKLAMAHPTDLEGIRIALASGVDVLVHTTLGVESAWPDELVRRMLDQRVAVVPTLQLWGLELDKRSAPEHVRRLLIDFTLAQLKGFVAAGGEVLFGTDVGYMTDFNPTEEYALMFKAGLTPMQILASLTTSPAARWREAKARGRLAAGLAADIVVLDGDPQEDPRNFAKVRCAFRAGRPIYVAGSVTRP